MGFQIISWQEAADDHDTSKPIEGEYIRYETRLEQFRQFLLASRKYVPAFSFIGGRSGIELYMCAVARYASLSLTLTSAISNLRLSPARAANSDPPKSLMAAYAASSLAAASTGSGGMPPPASRPPAATVPAVAPNKIILIEEYPFTGSGNYSRDDVSSDLHSEFLSIIRSAVDSSKYVIVFLLTNEHEKDQVDRVFDSSILTSPYVAQIKSVLTTALPLYRRLGLGDVLTCALYGDVGFSCNPVSNTALKKALNRIAMYGVARGIGWLQSDLGCLCCV